MSFVSAESISSGGNSVSAPPSLSGRFSIMNTNGVATGPVGKVTLRVNNNAAPGTYTIYPAGSLAATGVSGGVTITIPTAECSHTWDSGKETTAATCAKEGIKTFTCTACSETKTEAIPKLTTHTWDSGKVTTEATCTKDGVKTITCAVCKGTKTEAIPAAGHDTGKWVTITDATCKKDGLKELKCTVCSETLDSEIIPAAGIDHTAGEWLITTNPTCTKEGEKALICAVCGDELKNEAIPAAGHTDGDWVTTTNPTCTKEGEKALICAVCGDELKNEAIPATGHDDGEWVVVTEATCKTDGLKELQCTSCGEMLDSEVIFAADIDHIPGEWVTIIESTCTEDGEKAQRCTVCDEELATEAIAAKGHDDGKWAIVKPATREETGLKELRCIRCDALLDTAVIPVKTTDYYVKNTVCSFGPSFRETSALTDDWYRFTPVDLSVDGVQIFDLIASDAYIIGQVTVTVTDGTVTVDYKYVSDEVKEHSAFCTFLPSLAETATLELSEMKNYGFGNPISIADDLGGDTKVLLFICNVIDYNTDIPMTRMWPNTKDFTHKIDVLMERMIPKGVTLDSGVLVGELTPAIDAGLSTRWQHTQRGNVR